MVSAALTPTPQGHRRLQLEARKVAARRSAGAAAWPKSRLRSDTLVSASIDSDIAAGRHAADHLRLGLSPRAARSASPDDPEHQIPISSAEFGLDWDNARRTLRMPFKVTAGAARFTLRSEFAAPAQPGGNWLFAIGGGWSCSIR